MSRLISVAAMLQIADAHFIDPDLSRLLEGEPATSGHPENGPRPEPDELAVGFTPLMAAAGEKRSAWTWTDQEFQQAVAQYMLQPPSLLATTAGNGLTVEFPYGDNSSLCEMRGDQQHPRIGNGLLRLCCNFGRRRLVT